MPRARIIVLALVLALAVPAVVWAHGGGVDSYGGHNDRKNGGYHFHRGPLSGQSFPSKTSALAALRRHQEAGRTSNPAEPEDPAKVIRRASTAKKVDALIALLVKKGLFKEAELATEIKRERR